MVGAEAAAEEDPDHANEEDDDELDGLLGEWFIPGEEMMELDHMLAAEPLQEEVNIWEPYGRRESGEPCGATCCPTHMSHSTTVSVFSLEGRIEISMLSSPSLGWTCFSCFSFMFRMGFQRY